ncbi:MAG: sigma-70 family RNA polymerase sigma factor [Cyanobium sp.]|nr:MAG: sigma-70 family RNA polymerase sigma factor [Cyanobium sp.]
MAAGSGVPGEIGGAWWAGLLLGLAQLGLFLRRGLGSRVLRDQVMAHTQSQADALFQQFLPLADSIARGIAAGSRVIELEDARQVARMQLWLSCRQVSEPASAAGYLRRCIKGALLHHLRDHGRLVRVPRRQHEKGIHPWAHQSLHAPMPSGDHWIDQLEAPEQPGQPCGEGIEALLDRLPAGQAAIIRLSVLEGQSLRQIGAKLGISAMSVQRRRQKGLAALRAVLA